MKTTIAILSTLSSSESVTTDKNYTDPLDIVQGYLFHNAETVKVNPLSSTYSKGVENVQNNFLSDSTTVESFYYPLKQKFM